MLPQNSSNLNAPLQKKPDKSIDEEVKEALDVYDGWYNSLTDTFD